MFKRYYPSFQLPRYAYSPTFLQVHIDDLTFQIDGFKLHVMHSTQPFTSKVRTTSPAASHPQRAEKDLQNMKILASQLEDQAYLLSQESPEDEASKMDQGDHLTRGSRAVEARIEKLCRELTETHAGVADDILSAKRVRVLFFAGLSLVSNL